MSFFLSLGGWWQLRFYFCTAVLDLQKNWAGSTEVPYTSLHMYKVSAINMAQGWYICCNRWADIDTLLLKPVVAIRFAPCVVCSMSLYKCIMTCICHYRVIQSSSTARKILCVPLTHPFLLPSWIPGNHQSFYCRYSLPPFLYFINLSDLYTQRGS